MQKQPINFETLASRLEKMERQNRRLKLIGVVVLLLIGVIFLMGQALHPEVIFAHKYALLDKQGEVCGFFSGDGEGPSLCIGRGRAVITMDVRNNGAISFVMQDRQYGDVGIHIGPGYETPKIQIAKTKELFWSVP